MHLCRELFTEITFWSEETVNSTIRRVIQEAVDDFNNQNNCAKNKQINFINLPLQSLHWFVYKNISLKYIIESEYTQ